MTHSEELGITHIHNPKTGGISVLNALKKVDPNVVHESHVPLSRCKYRHSSTTFAVVRHPCDRFLSAWAFVRDRRTMFGEKPKQNLFTMTTPDLAVKYISRSWGLLELNNLGYALRQGGDTCWARQVNMLQADDVEIDHIFDFEDLSTMWDWLSEFGIDPVVVNKSKRPRDWKSCFHPESIRILKDLYREDFELYGRVSGKSEL